MRPGCPGRAPLQPRARPERLGPRTPGEVARGCPLENLPGAAPARSGHAPGGAVADARSRCPRTRARAYSRWRFDEIALGRTRGPGERPRTRPQRPPGEREIATKLLRAGPNARERWCLPKWDRHHHSNVVLIPADTPDAPDATQGVSLQSNIQPLSASL
eukprot:4641417-Pyramimonas_sp.AAC.1